MKKSFIIGRRKGVLLLAMLHLLVFLSQTGDGWTEERARRLTLEKAYALALETNEEIKIAATEIEKSNLLPEKALSVMLPQISAAGGGYRLSEQITNTGEFIAAPGFPPFSFEYDAIPQDRIQGEFEFVQPLFRANFFPLRRQAVQIIDRSVETHRQTVQDTLFQVAEAYYEVLKAQELVQNVNRMLELAHEELSVAKTRFAAGAVTEDVVLRSELDVTVVQSRMIEHSNQLIIAQDSLKALIGLGAASPELEKPLEISKFTEGYNALVDMALVYRPDYRIGLFNQAVAKNNIDLEKSRFYPSVDGGWSYYGVNHPTNYQDDNYWIASLVIRLPIFDGGLRIWDLKESHLSFQQASLAVEALQKAIPVEVNNALLTTQASESILGNAVKQVDLANKNYDIVFSKFNYGAATSVELSQARTLLEAAQVGRITSYYDYQIDLLELRRSVGLFACEMITQEKEK